MTREEAIKELTEWLDGCCGEELEPTRKALRMAVDALKAQMDEDTISRQAALNAFSITDASTKYGGDHSGYDTRMLYEIKDILEGLPSAQPEIIHCWECKHCYVDGGSVRFNVCSLNHNKVQGDDWYCADAERRTDETNQQTGGI